MEAHPLFYWKKIHGRFGKCQERWKQPDPRISHRVLLLWYWCPGTCTICTRVLRSSKPKQSQKHGETWWHVVGSWHGATPIAGCFFGGKIPSINDYKWMMNRGTPISGNLHMGSNKRNTSILGTAKCRAQNMGPTTGKSMAWFVLISFSTEWPSLKPRTLLFGHWNTGRVMFLVDTVRVDRCPFLLIANPGLTQWSQEPMTGQQHQGWQIETNRVPEAVECSIYTRIYA